MNIPVRRALLLAILTGVASSVAYMTLSCQIEMGNILEIAQQQGCQNRLNITDSFYVSILLLSDDQNLQRM